MSVADNLAFRDFDRAAVRARRLVAQRARVPRAGELRKIDQYKIKTRGAATRDRRAFGRQRAARRAGARAGRRGRILIAANPCFGLDFAAVAQIHAEIMAVRNRGAAVLLVSEDLDELLELADRVVVMFDGTDRLRGAAQPQADLTEIGRHMAGH